jgi:hypothetical protein
MFATTDTRQLASDSPVTLLTASVTSFLYYNLNYRPSMSMLPSPTFVPFSVRFQFTRSTGHFNK